MSSNVLRDMTVVNKGSSPIITGDEKLGVTFTGEWAETGYGTHQTAHYGKERITPNAEIIEQITEHCKLFPNFKLVSCNLCWYVRAADNNNSWKPCINFNEDGQQVFSIELQNDLDKPFTITEWAEDERPHWQDLGCNRDTFVFFLGQAWEIFFTIDGNDFLEGKPVYVCTHKQFEDGIKKWRPSLFEKESYYKDIHFLGSGWCEQNKVEDYHNVLSPIDQPMGLSNWMFSRLVSRVLQRGLKFPGLIAQTSDKDRQVRLTAINRLQSLRQPAGTK